MLTPDAWGNEQYSAPVTIAAFVDDLTLSFGQEDGDNKQDAVEEGTGSLITDYMAIRPNDRITLPDGTVTYVTEAVTGHDEKGANYYQTITVSTAERG